MCEKFGLAWGEAAKLVPEIIRAGQIKSAMRLGISTAIAVVGAVVLILRVRDARRQQKVAKYPDDLSEYLFDFYGDFPRALLSALSIAVLVVSVPMAISGLRGLLNWALAPNVAALEYVIDMMK